MTDRELLELAAKAAGIQIAHFSSCGEPRIRHPGGGPEACMVYPWSPLTDDGDALRLATKLHFDIFVINNKLVKVKAPRISDIFSSSGGNDINLITRYTIVRAAAEIGRAMP